MKTNNTMNYPLWHRIRDDVKPIDVFMILFLILVMGFFLYVNYVHVNEPDTKQSSEKSK